MRKDLVSLLRQRLEHSPPDGPDWVIGVQVACAVQDMETTLRLAGLDGGVEPERP